MLPRSRTLPPRMHDSVVVVEAERDVRRYQQLPQVERTTTTTTTTKRQQQQLVQVEKKKICEEEEEVDDDGRAKRTGTVWTAASHIITAVIGSGVLSLAWAIAQLGWVVGPAVMLLFATVIYFTSNLLADCYRTGDPATGRRNYTYMDAVKANLGGAKVKVCGCIQYLNLLGVAIGYTIAASISMMAIQRSNCFHARGENKADPCHASSNVYMIIFGVVQVFFSQIPDFDQGWWLSILAALMSFTYSAVGLSLGAAQVSRNRTFAGSAMGVAVGFVTKSGALVTPAQKVWRMQPAGAGRHRLRLLLLHHPHRDPGHAPLAAGGGEEHAQGHGHQRRRHHRLLPAVRMHGLRRVRRRRAGEPPHGLRLLQPLLAAGRGQHGRRRPPGGGVPGVLPAALRLRGEEGGAAVAQRPPWRRVRATATATEVEVERLQGGVADVLRGGDDGGGHAAAILQRRRGHPGGARLLAAHRLLPRRDVHRAPPHQEVDHHLGGAAGAQPGLPARLARRRRRLHRGCRAGPQVVPPLPLHLLAPSRVSLPLFGSPIMQASPQVCVCTSRNKSTGHPSTLRRVCLTSFISNTRNLHPYNLGPIAVRCLVSLMCHLSQQKKCETHI